MKNTKAKLMLKGLEKRVRFMSYNPPVRTQRYVEFPLGFKQTQGWEEVCEYWGVYMQQDTTNQKRWLVTSPTLEGMVAFVRLYNCNATAFDVSWIPYSTTLTSEKLVVYPETPKGTRFKKERVSSGELSKVLE